MQLFILLYFLILLRKGSLDAQKLSKEDVLKIPHIDNLSPYITELFNITFSLHISEMELEEKNSQFRMYAKLIWVASWRDCRIADIKDEVYYFTKNQIWTPEIHSYSNEISEEKIKSYYTETISLRKNGNMEAFVFEDFETTCQLAGINVVECYIGLAGYFGFLYNYQQRFVCYDEKCLKFTDSFLKINNESRDWNLQKTTFLKFKTYDNNSWFEFGIHFSRGVDIANNIVKTSPIILSISLLTQFILPINSKIRFVINTFCYILTLLMILTLQFEFFNLDIEQESDIGEFYAFALFFVTLAWMWNAFSGNIWISCSHDYKPSLGTLSSRIMTHKCLAWIIPNEIVETESYLMKIIFLVDKIVFIIVVVFMVGTLVKMESFIRLWK